MFLDASAIIAIIARESDAAALAGRLRQAKEVHTSPIAVYEAVLGLARVGNTSIQDAEIVLNRFLEEVQAEIMSIGAEIGRSAIAAFDRFGKGRHPAGLNMGDCFAYACASQLDLPILFKGDDFPQTDIAVA
jgi:ribonuclease VapC